jgi:hypothetical protein
MSSTKNSHEYFQEEYNKIKNSLKNDGFKSNSNSELDSFYLTSDNSKQNNLDSFYGSIHPDASTIQGSFLDFFNTKTI